MLSNWIISPKNRGENKKYLKTPTLSKTDFAMLTINDDDVDHRKLPKTPWVARTNRIQTEPSLNSCGLGNYSAGFALYLFG